MTTDPRKAILMAAALILFLLVAWAFALVGSPAKNRALTEDRARLKGLSCMACFAQQYACANGNFPPDHETLLKYMNEQNRNRMWCSQKGLSCNYNYGVMDVPERLDMNRYEGFGKESYSLCATLNYSSEEAEINQTTNWVPVEMKGYKSGEQCFTFLPRKCPETRK